MAFGLQAQNPHGKGFRMDCAQCHSSGSWSFNAKAKFRHETTGFGLEGQHKTIECKACHTNLNFKKTSSSCVSCHSDMHNQTVGNDCARCHTTQSWIVENIAKIHDNTSFPLVGVHKTVNCNQCHKTATKLQYSPLGQTCVDCHKTDFQQAKSPNHVKLNLSNDCASCHNTTVQEWKTRKFPDHNAVYPLTGAHAGIAQDCEKCHQGGDYSNTPRQCAGCHQTNYNQAQNPNHQRLNLSTDCATCHTTNPGWAPATFANHDQVYPLTGAHKTIANDCAQCHKGGNYSPMPNDCNACHAANYAKTSNPNHANLGISNDCASCHSTNPNWAPAKFTQHNQFYPLVGAHSTLQCNQCHQNGTYKNTPTECNACHNQAYQKATNPNHLSHGIGTDCASCHSTNPGWQPAKFAQHNNFFPLSGAHSSLSCSECHKNGSYTGTPKTCNECHNSAYNASKNPNHASNGFSTDCASCHTTNPGWRPSTFNHNAFYPLTGAHSTATCTACHKNGIYKNTPRDCNACHNANYQSAQNPNHASNGFSTDCASCHTTNPGWRPSTFNHNAFYPLTGAHSTATCTACHKNGTYKNTPTDCNSCHNAAYTSSTNPNHRTVGLSIDCASCHTTNPGWRPSTFNHNSVYPLQGAHAAMVSNCTACHKTGDVKAAPTTCYGCHASDYTSATPNHASAGFPTNCTSCHSQNAWSPSTWNHDAQYFPIYSGKHKGKWSNCNECHTTPGNFSVFNCLNCHKKTSTDNDHRGVTGYSYNSIACFTCHPRGDD
jgi:hypothetical protein